MAANIEIKARARDIARQLRLAIEMSPTPAQEMWQEDVFFNAPSGRLKLRIFENRTGELIYYDREDSTGPRVSRYFISRTNDPQGLRDVLAVSLGVRGVVKKRRTLVLVGDIRVHADKVEELGDFLELEYVMRDDTVQADAMAAVKELMQRLGIEEGDLVGSAYIDLVPKRERLARGQPSEPQHIP